MLTAITSMALVVREYDEAIAFYVGKLGFVLHEDTDMGGGKRWVTVGPKGDGFRLLLARAVNEEQKRSVGNQTGGRVFLFVHTNSFDTDYERFRSQGIRFVREPVNERWGKVAVFADLYGNLWDLIQPA